MNRRDFLRVLLGTTAASYVDYEKLLWIPGEKTIFIPSKRQIEFLSESQIIALEITRINHTLKALFERDDCFYKRMIFPNSK